jgi:activator of HSP90 ATPase
MVNCGGGAGETKFNRRGKTMRENVPLAGRKEVTMRQVLAGSAMALGGLALGARVAPARATGRQEGMAKAPSSGANKLRTTIHQELEFHAAPQRIYEALLDSKQFAAFTGLPAEIRRDAGGAISMFGARIVGRNVELVADRRIVQAWREASWEPGVYSLVKFELKARGTGTNLVFDHWGFSEGDFDHLDEGWKARYWEPLAKYLAQNG